MLGSVSIVTAADLVAETPSTVTSANARLNLTMVASVLRTVCAKVVIVVLVSQKFIHTASRLQTFQFVVTILKGRFISIENATASI